MGISESFAWETPMFIHCFSLIILAMFLSDSHSKNHGFKTQRYYFFQYMVISNIFLLITDSLCWIAMGRPGTLMHLTHIASTTAFYVLDPLPSYFFLRFTDVVLGVPAEKEKRLLRWYSLPVLMHMAIALVSPFTGWFFNITPENQYLRGSLLPLSFFLSFLLMFVGAFKAIKRYIRAKRANDEIAKNVREYSWLIKFTVIPLIGGILQLFFNNVTFVWNISVIALLVLYINNQNAELTTDTLTGLYNRRQAFAYFDRFVRENEKEKDSTAVVVLDINNFKTINDVYGHIMGDEAIIAVARAMEKEFRWDDCICRFGGDEFMVITKYGAKDPMEAAVARVNARLKKLHDVGTLPFALSVSAGYAMWKQKDQTLDSLFHQADMMMLQQKAALMRRATDKR
ncbi:MAG: GGDEF domain-containing protein [Eubacteriales bacterium]|nr:GGDEF domain-containing protein [Eubacteriales bacterium]